MELPRRLTKSCRLLGFWVVFMLLQLSSLQTFADLPHGGWKQNDQIHEVSPWDKDVTVLPDSNLWRHSFSSVLDSPNFKPKFALYHLSTVLMFPMIASFRLHKRTQIRQFASFFDAFLRFYSHKRFQGKDSYVGALNQQVFLLFASEYMRLAKSAGVKVNPRLTQFVTKAFHHVWTKPAWTWPVCKNAQTLKFEGKSYYGYLGGISERINWKLTHPNPRPHYCSVIYDQDFMPFGIAANLQAFYGNKAPSYLKSILTLAHITFTHTVSDSKLSQNGWEFQSGAWRGHPSYRFVNSQHDSAYTYDIAHSSRFAIVLDSLRIAATSVKRKQYYQTLEKCLLNQFASTIVKPTGSFPAYRTTNFLDGSNGTYMNANTESGPYALSITLYLAWWNNLINRQNAKASSAIALTKTYCKIKDLFPLNNGVIAFLSEASPQTSYLFSDHNKNSLVSGQEIWRNGGMQLIARYACEIGKAMQAQ